MNENYLATDLASNKIRMTPRVHEIRKGAQSSQIKEDIIWTEASSESMGVRIDNLCDTISCASPLKAMDYERRTRNLSKRALGGIS
jgi:hypothetical protein